MELEQFRLMVERNDYRGIADELARLEAERGVIDITALGDDPESAVVDSFELELEYATDFAPTCSVYGYYRYRDGEPSALIHRCDGVCGGGVSRNVLLTWVNCW